uniref:Uncharacterized protein n=1 Tax=Ditylenchus dipsaci TaxID=166011 RepID=A0A915DWW8_9BILA
MTSSEMSDMLKLRTVEDTINLAVKDQHSPKNALLFLLDCAGPEVVNLEMKEELSKHSAEIRKSFLNGHFAVEGDKDSNFRRYDTVADAGKTRGPADSPIGKKDPTHVKGSIRKVYQTISEIVLAKIYIEAELVLDKDKPGGSKRTQLFLFGAMGARKFGHIYVYDILKNSIGRSTDIEQLKGVAREFRKRRLDLWLEVEKEVREAKAMLENSQNMHNAKFVEIYFG